MRICFEPGNRGMSKRPSPPAMPRARKRPDESEIVTTAPVIGSCVELSVSVPRTRWARAGVAATAAKTAPTTRLRTTRGYLLDAFDQTIDLLFGRVATAARAHEAAAVSTDAVPVGDCGRVEVAVRHEHAPLRELGRDVVRRAPGQRERQRRRATATRLRPVQPDTVDFLQRIPELLEQRGIARLEPAQRLHDAVAP